MMSTGGIISLEEVEGVMATAQVHHAWGNVLTRNNLTHTENKGFLYLRCFSYCRWVEMMAPVFSKAAWRCSWYLIQNDLIHGWGIDFQLGYCAQANHKSMPK